MVWYKLNVYPKIYRCYKPKWGLVFVILFFKLSDLTSIMKN